jgi:hypothetical protein
MPMPDREAGENWLCSGEKLSIVVHVKLNPDAESTGEGNQAINEREQYAYINERLDHLGIVAGCARRSA